MLRSRPVGRKFCHADDIPACHLGHPPFALCFKIVQGHFLQDDRVPVLKALLDWHEIPAQPGLFTSFRRIGSGHRSNLVREGGDADHRHRNRWETLPICHVDHKRIAFPARREPVSRDAERDRRFSRSTSQLQNFHSFFTETDPQPTPSSRRPRIRQDHNNRNNRLLRTLPTSPVPTSPPARSLPSLQTT